MSIKYTHDENGNLKTKWDARGIKTIYDYDALNRVWQRCYKSVGTSSLGYTTCSTASSETDEANTPDVTLYYDNLTNAKGRLIRTASSVSTTEYTSFDISGHVTASKQTTDGVIYGNGTADSPMTYTYNLSGALIEQQYPSGRKVQNTLDSSGDLEMVKSRKNANAGYWAYANNFSYNAAGAVTSMQLGNSHWESTIFNSRLQPTQIALGTVQNGANYLDLDYEYGSTASVNNGNVTKQMINVATVGTSTGFSAVQTYTYDSLNRLNDATENLTPIGSSATQTWKQSFKYDRYGNRNFLTGTGETTTIGSCATAVCNAEISPSNNKITSTGYTFDAAGNTSFDAALRKFTYDAENKQTKVESTDANQNVTGTVGQYWYDGDGKRVKKIVPPTGELTIFVYDAIGKLIGEYSTIVASTNDAKVAYLTNDHLGSPRINTDANGAVIARHDYQPFGEEVATTQRVSGLGYTNDTVRKQFTGYERDGESGLDFAEARMYSITLGRFTTCDPLMASAIVITPQSWNRYSYVLNNPLNLIDPDGELPPGLTANQIRLFQTFTDNYNRVYKTNLSVDDVWKLLSQSQQSTFLAVTHALENSKVTTVEKDKDGKKKKVTVSAISLVDSISQITGAFGDAQVTPGGQAGEGGNEQFRLLVTLKKGAIQTLDSAKEFHKSTGSHLFENGVVREGDGTFRQGMILFATPSMQISFLNSGTADIDVDYRSKFSPSHWVPGNSDVRSGDNLKTHNKKYGKENPLRNIPTKPR